MARLIKKDSSNFTVVSNQLIRDSRLSWKARGIFSYLWSQANNWQFYVKEIATHAPDGEKSLQSGLKELEEYGYLTRKMRQTSKGFGGMDWILDDKPDPRQAEKGVNAKMSDNSEKNGHYASDAKGVQREKRPTQDGGLRNNNLKKEQLEEESIVRKEDIDSSGKPEPHPPYKEIITYLNKKTGTRYKVTSKATQRLIKARWNEGYTLDDFIAVIDKKVAEWGSDDKMNKYLRPVTLFGTKFEDYLNQKGVQDSRTPVSGGYDASGPDMSDEDMESLLNQMPF